MANKSARVYFNYEVEAAKVYAAWLDPASIAQFMFGPRLRQNEKVIHIQLDARVGGKFSFLIERAGQQLDHVGHYLVLDDPRQLKFTWGVVGQPEHSEVQIDISPKPGGCEVVLDHELSPEWEEFGPQIAASWRKMLVALGSVID